MGTLTVGARTSGLVRLITRLHPELHDLFDPHGPLLMSSVTRAAEAGDTVETALNPQPLPPRDALLLAVRQTVKGVAEAAIVADQIGRDAGETLHEVGDDLCPPPPHSKIPWPRRWPGPWPPGEPYPIDIDPEFMTPAVQATAGLAFQAYADGVADPKLSAAFGELADRLCETALSNGVSG
ncbi:hypothetical protein F9278_38480 [Streptomyces phaeolivaceus]|uniref:Uncharacterized protein n=1 Tax=Streptomyces phaeolivaceus TaxID=2653200 RepID=A0A5P8KCP4_9ACTN|nr:hypothetical protein [Streptomyces phaeolivaceus]QFR01104.1 hypothetical protein F9278_38480 [Streptomyces phaeolivaceus]